MNTRHLITAPILAGLLLATALVGAQEAPKSHSHAHDAAAAGAGSPQKLSADVQSSVDAVDRFSKSLKSGDLKAVESLLDPEVLILESGGAERSRQEYLSHHASSDAKFLKDAHVQLLHRTAERSGDMVWVGSESEIHTQKEGKPFTLLSAESMVLKEVGGDWKIVHIHWSSRPKK